MQPAAWPVIAPGGSQQFGMDVVFPNVPPGGVDPDGFDVVGTYRDRAQSAEYPVITEWRTSKEGARGKFDTSS